MVFRRTSAFKNFKDIKAQLETMERILVLRGDEPVAVILSIEDYRSVEAMLRTYTQLMNNPEKYKELLRKHQDFQAGKREGLATEEDLEKVLSESK